MSLTDLSVTDFLTELASEAPAPGGGSAAALAGALAAALSGMVARLTLGREKYKAAWPEMEALKSEAASAQADLVRLVDRDAQAYNQILAALKLPKGSVAEKTARTQALEAATWTASETPLETLARAAQAAELAQRAAARGNPNAVTDAGVAAALARAAAQGATANVLVNLAALPQGGRREELAGQARTLLARAEKAAQATAVLLADRLGQ